MNVLVAFLMIMGLSHLGFGVLLTFSEVQAPPMLQAQKADAPPDPKEEKKEEKNEERKEEKEEEESSKKDDTRKTSDRTIISPNLTVKLAFMADPRLFPYDIECQVREKSVELTGVVAFEEEKIYAALLASELMQEKKILNHLEVRPALYGTNQAATDARLTELVKQRFAKSQTLKEANFEVITIRGMVSLRGQTRFQVIALEAAQTAREIPGVLAVNTEQVRIEGEND